MFEARLPVTPECASMITEETRQSICEYFERGGSAEMQIQDIQEGLADNNKPQDRGLTMIRQEYGNLWLKREYWA